MKFGLGLVIGKFYPPHRGHKLLIDEAVTQSERAVVIVCGKPTDTIPGELRGQWLQEIHPTAQVMVIDDHYDENDSRVRAENTTRWLGRAPDAVFTSEDYGDRYPKDSLRLITREPHFGFPAKLPVGQWSHVAATVDGQTGKQIIFINGKPVAAN